MEWEQDIRRGGSPTADPEIVPCPASVEWELRLVLDGQGGEVRVGRQIATPAHRLEEIEQNVRMTNSRVDKNRLRSNEPRPDTPASTIHVEGIVEYLRMRGDADEPQDRDPRKADAAGPVQQRFPPLPRRPVPLEF